MTNFARTPARSGANSRPLMSYLLTLAVSALLLMLAAPAGAEVVTVGSASVGLQPRSEALVSPASTGFENPNGNAVVNGASVYVVYWDPQAWFHHEWVANIDTFMQDFGSSSGSFNTIFSALGQYRDRANEQASYKDVFKGAYSDTAAYPSGGCTDPEPMLFGQITCLTDTQVREQLQSFIATHGTPTGMHSIYYLLTPPGVTLCLDNAGTHCSDFALTSKEISEGKRSSTSYKNSFCSYHGDINPDGAAEGDGNTILYGAIPWVAGGEGSPWSYIPGVSDYGQAYDCQDGGWVVEDGEVVKEKAHEKTEEEEKAFTKMNNKEKEEALKAERLEGPHIQEPNQEPLLKEEGDFASGLSDVIVSQIAVEQANIVTDPLLSSWQNQSTHKEATDECRDQYGSYTEPSKLEGSVLANSDTEAGTLSNEDMGAHRYYINNVVNVGALHRNTCVGGAGLVPRFTSPNPVNAGEEVDFDGMESTVSDFEGSIFGPTGPPTTTYAQFAWSFGDGATATGYAPGAPICAAPWLSPCAASEFHTYTYGGTYTVTLTITDVAGNKATISHEVTVDGPAPPAGSSTTGTGTGTSTSGGASTTSGATSLTGTPPPSAPVAKAAFASHSLRSAIQKGIAVSYSVNEKVAGRFELLMAASLAKKLKISGKPATGLPAGTPAEIVIASSVLVTTKGGHSTLHIKLPAKVKARLRHAGKAALMLRLSVHNSSSSTPQSSTTISAVTLSH